MIDTNPKNPNQSPKLMTRPKPSEYLLLIGEIKKYFTEDKELKFDTETEIITAKVGIISFDSKANQPVMLMHLKNDKNITTIDLSIMYYLRENNLTKRNVFTNGGATIEINFTKTRIKVISCSVDLGGPCYDELVSIIHEIFGEHFAIEIANLARGSLKTKDQSMKVAGVLYK